MESTTLLISSGIGLTLTAAGILAHDVAQELQHRRTLGAQGILPMAAMLPMRWRTTVAFALLAWAPLLLAAGLLLCACTTSGANGG